jgi:hypothetical protein
MIQIQALGAPFPVQSSSCSTIQPKFFQWTDNPSSIRVFIDNAIPSNQDRFKSDYAWICESKVIIPDVYTFVKASLPYMKTAFKKVFTCDQELLSIDPMFVYNPNGSNYPWVRPIDGTIPKTKNVSMFCSAKAFTTGHQKRIEFATKNRDKFDLYGSIDGGKYLGNNGTPWPDKSEGLLPYKFSVVIENACYDDYWTEKLTDCFGTLTIPIYRGCPSIGKYFDSRGIIFLTDDFDFTCLTPELYESMLPYAIENRNKLKTMLIADDQLYLSIFKK